MLIPTRRAWVAIPGQDRAIKVACECKAESVFVQEDKYLGRRCVRCGHRVRP